MQATWGGSVWDGVPWDSDPIGDVTHAKHTRLESTGQRRGLDPERSTGQARKIDPRQSQGTAR